MRSPAPAEPGGVPLPGNRKVLHVITRLDRGGSADNTLLTCRGLVERGWNVDLVYGRTVHPTPLLRELEPETGVGIRLLPSLVRPVSPFQDLQAFRSLRSIQESGRYDLVHSHSSKAGILTRAAARKLPCKVVHTPHGHAFHGYLPPLASRVALCLERIAAKWCDRIIVLTDRGREEHLAMRVGAPAQFRTIPSGIDLDRFREVRHDRDSARATLGIPPGAFVIGSVARLVRIKGVEHIVDAMEELCRRHRNLVLLLTGDGDLRHALEARVGTGPLAGRTVFTGHMEDPAAAYASMDLFLLASLNEGQGRSVIEAMSAGIPVIASDVGGLPEVLAGGRAGILVPPGSPAALATAVEKLLRSPELTRRLVKEAFRHILGYGDSTMIDRIEQTYTELLAGNPEGASR